MFYFTKWLNFLNFHICYVLKGSKKGTSCTSSNGWNRMWCQMINEDTENKRSKKERGKYRTWWECTGLFLQPHPTWSHHPRKLHYMQQSHNYSYLWTHDLYGLVRNAFDAGKSITRARRRGLGPEFQDFLGPVKWHRAFRRVSFGAPGPYQSKVHR